MEEEQNHVIYTFPRGKGEEVQIALRKYDGKYYIDLRQWFQSKNESVFKPTKKGVYFSVDAIGELQKGVERLALAISRHKKKKEESIIL